MLRRLVAVIGLVLAIGGFILLPISIFKNINFMVPVGMILGAFLLLLLAKNMEAPDDGSDNGGADQGGA